MAPSLLTDAPQLDAADVPTYVVNLTSARSARYRTETMSQRIAAAWRRRGAATTRVIPSAVPPSPLDAVGVLRYEATVRQNWLATLKASKAPQIGAMLLAAGAIGWFVGHQQVTPSEPAEPLAAVAPDVPSVVERQDPAAASALLASPVAGLPSDVAVPAAKPAAPAAKPVTAPALGPDGKRLANLTYTVKPGDNFGSIAKRFQLRPRTVRLVNELPLGARLRPGQKLVITPYDGAYHRVAEGETLSHLLVRYSVSRQAVLERNPGLASAHLHPGQKIFIPGATRLLTARGDARGYRQGGAYANRLNASRSLIGQFGNRVGQLSMPTHGDFSSPFGVRGHSFHPGMDISGAVGRPITAAKAGVVVAAGWAGAYGYAVDIDHGGGVVTRYGHCSRVLVRRGQEVNAGDLIAKMGSTGRSTGPHLHFEVRIQDRAVNPAGFL